MNLKQMAAEQAAVLVESGMKVGLGTGSTVRFLLEALGRRIQEGTLSEIVCVPTSEATAALARQLNITLTTLEQCPHLDLTIDGADEISPELYLIKGLGGALLREKIVAAASKRFVIIADDSKRVEQLGSVSPLPVEVLPFGWTSNLPLFEQLGARPVLRKTDEGQPYVTDNGNYIVDCSFPEGIADPYDTAQRLDAQAGVLGHGLFLGMADLAYVGSADGVAVIDVYPSGRSSNR
jgi:ribose 5-phosphate isomerase A